MRKAPSVSEVVVFTVTCIQLSLGGMMLDAYGCDVFRFTVLLPSIAVNVLS